MFCSSNASSSYNSYQPSTMVNQQQQQQSHQRYTSPYQSSLWPSPPTDPLLEPSHHAQQQQQEEFLSLSNYGNYAKYPSTNISIEASVAMSHAHHPQQMHHQHSPLSQPQTPSVYPTVYPGNSSYYSQSSTTTTTLYSSFQAPLNTATGSGPVPPLNNRLSQASSSRSLYMPPTPPSSEPGSPSQQQQQMQQQLKNRQVHTGLSSGYRNAAPASTSTPPTQSKQQQQPPYANCVSSALVGSRPSNGKSATLAAPMAHFTLGFQVSSNCAGAVHLNGTVTIPASTFSTSSNGSSSSNSSPPPSTSSEESSHSQSSKQRTQHFGPSSHVPHQPRFNRRNNPELEKRRIHRCDYPG